jgi:lipoyl(octanoyl) transferase
VTYHGPGQLVGYPIFDLRSLRNTSIGAPDDRSSSSGQSGGRLGPVDFVRRMEEALIRLCGVYGVRAARIPGLTGVWCPGAAHASPLDETGDSANPRKIAAIGIHVARGITSHGFALNVTTDLRDFELIVPCGIADHGVTSLARETHDPAALPDLESIAHQAARQFGQVFAQPVLAVESLDALRAHAASKCEEAAAPQPPQDTPLAIPPEVQRLHGAPEKPVRA